MRTNACKQQYINTTIWLQKWILETRIVIHCLVSESQKLKFGSAEQRLVWWVYMSAFSILIVQNRRWTCTAAAACYTAMLMEQSVPTPVEDDTEEASGK